MLVQVHSMLSGAALDVRSRLNACIEVQERACISEQLAEAFSLLALAKMLGNRTMMNFKTEIGCLILVSGSSAHRILIHMSI